MVQVFHSAAEVLPVYIGFIESTSYVESCKLVTGFGIYTPVQQLLWLLNVSYVVWVNMCMRLIPFLTLQQ